jgi:plasmid stabilization system protein ParE
MALKIQWTKRAEKSFDEIFKFIKDNWSENSAGKFVKTTNKKLKRISENPQMYPEIENKESVRKAVITKQTSVYYKIFKEFVRLITFWDNRRNPDNLKI